MSDGKQEEDGLLAVVRDTSAGALLGWADGWTNPDESGIQYRIRVHEAFGDDPATGAILSVVEASDRDGLRALDGENLFRVRVLTERFREGEAAEVKIFSWDWKEQPPLRDVFQAVSEMSPRGDITITLPDTGSDQYALIISARPLTADEARIVYQAWLQSPS